jgi:hypothetical protein
MKNTFRKVYQTQAQATMPKVTALHAPLGSPRRAAAEAFIRDIFASHYNARVSTFAPNLLLIEKHHAIMAATGWRSAQAETLFLERYLATPIENHIAKLANQPVLRERIVEVGHLASQKAGASVHIIRELASHLNEQGFEWVVFTATQELIGIFSKLGLPLLALAVADPNCLGADANNWGSYYDTQPIVVAGKIRLALQRLEHVA